MLAVAISWIAILIVFLSFGDFLILLYNKLCKRDERYGFTDTFLLGMCFALTPLSLTSLWLPSNQYILLSYLLLCIIYWGIRKDHFVSVLRSVRVRISQYSFLQILFFIIPVVSIMAVIVWQVGVFDSLYYHQQNIRWNEEYAVVPGLGNIEHRFGFNSNYLLLSAIFSFRFIFGEAVYGLQALVLVVIICWIIQEIIQSGYEIRRVMLLLVFTGYIFIFGYTLTATSTDAIPNIVAFYLIAKLLLLSEPLKRKALLLVVVPVSMITFKLSMIGLGFISLYIAYILVKEYRYKDVILTVGISFLIVALWCIRNVIITGYLVFPLNEIDLFSVDWKMPEAVAIEERDFILTCGILALKDVWVFLNIFADHISLKGIITHDGVYLSMAASIILSPFVVLYCLLKKKYLGKGIYLAYLVLVSLVLIWYKGGPDPRFLGGVLFAFVFFTAFLLLSTKEERCFRWVGMMFLSVFMCLMIIWPVTRTIRFYDMFGLWNKKEGVRPASDALVKQYPYRELLKSRRFYIDEFLPYQLSNTITIYSSKSPEIPNGRFVCFDAPFPCIVLKADNPMKYQYISNIEPKGTTIQDGFRPKIK